MEIAKDLDDLAALDVWSADVCQRCYDLVAANVEEDDLLGYVHDDLIHYTGTRLFRSAPRYRVGRDNFDSVSATQQVQGELSRALLGA